MHCFLSQSSEPFLSFLRYVKLLDYTLSNKINNMVKALSSICLTRKGHQNITECCNHGNIIGSIITSDADDLDLCKHTLVRKV